MSKLIQTTSPGVYKQFTFIWTLLTAVFLLIALYINWELSIQKSYKDILQVATTLTNNVDRFIEDLFQEVYALPVYEKNFTDCKTGLYPYLERITLNNPKISGLIISNDKKIICSTLPDNEGYISSPTTTRSIIGPFNFKVFDQPVYIIQQKLAHNHIGIIVLASTFKNVLKTSDTNSNAISLYNENNKRILRIERNSNLSDWSFHNNLASKSLLNTSAIHASDNLHSIDEVKIFVSENRQTLFRTIWYSEIAVCILVSLISYLLFIILKSRIAKRYSLLGAMKLAIKNKEFYPEYQPLFDRKSGKYTGAEVLLRWQDDQDKIIMPDFFIQEAESTGIIVPITLQIIEIAFKESRDILTHYPDFHLAFNISALHFTSKTFFTKFNLLMKRYNILPAQVIFEITERDLLDKNNSIFSEKMLGLRKNGFSLAVDDYGTGHASISYLQNFPFNYLKIDKLFIQAIGTKAITESLNDAIISMAKSLNLTIIAEGVETKEQVEYLSENGVRFLQGWYFSKALPIEKLINLIKGATNESQP